MKGFTFKFATSTVISSLAIDLLRMKMNESSESQSRYLGDFSIDCTVTNMAIDYVTENLYFVCEKERIMVCNVKRGSVYCANLKESIRFEISSIELNSTDG